MKFEIGDRVICTKDHPDGNQYLFAERSTGTVMAIEPDYYGVSWDVEQNSIFSKLSGEITTYTGWYVGENEIRKLDDDFDVSSEDVLAMLCGGGRV